MSAEQLKKKIAKQKAIECYTSIVYFDEYMLCKRTRFFNKRGVFITEEISLMSEDELKKIKKNQLGQSGQFKKFKGKK